MHIARKISQYRRDFRAVYACAACGHEVEKDGYDDAYFHTQVVPDMPCPECKTRGGGPTTTPDVPAHVII